MILARNGEVDRDGIDRLMPGSLADISPAPKGSSPHLKNTKNALKASEKNRSFYGSTASDEIAIIWSRIE
jgi:hypothetical protein